MPEIGRVVLNIQAQARVFNDSDSNTGLGSLSLYGDSETQKVLKKEVLNPERFEDLMVELYVSAWHISEGHPVEKIKSGKTTASDIAKKSPDFIITLPRDLRLVIECKHMRASSKPSRIKKYIDNANKQIKSVSEDLDGSYYGAVVIDVTSFKGINQVLDDTLPPDFDPLLEAGKAALRGNKNRSLGAAVLVWDDYMKFGAPPRLYYGYRRRFVRLLNDSAHIPISKNAPIFEGNTLEYWLINNKLRAPQESF